MMEPNTFDTYTRLMGVTASSRRHALRALGALFLGGAAAKLGLPDRVAAKAKKHGKRKAKRKQSDSLQAAGKHRNKHKNKHRHKPKDLPPLPPGCENCAECQMCQDGACVADPDLERVFCGVDGMACSYCQQGVCTFFQEACDDGACPQKGYCCPGEKQCPSIESPTGFFCIKGDACCEGKKKCGDQCIPVASCCDADKPPCGECEVSKCVQGSWGCSPDDTCGPPCGEGYCPVGMSCYYSGDPSRQGVCCDSAVPWPHCVCASGYTGGCNGQCCRHGCCGTYCCPAPDAS